MVHLSMIPMGKKICARDMTYCTLAFSGGSSEGYEIFASIFQRHYAIHTLMSETLQDLLNLLFKEPESDSLSVTHILPLSHTYCPCHAHTVAVTQTETVWASQQRLLWKYEMCMKKWKCLYKWDLFWRLICQLPDRWWDLKMLDFTYQSVSDIRQSICTLYTVSVRWKLKIIWHVKGKP